MKTKRNSIGRNRYSLRITIVVIVKRYIRFLTFNYVTPEQLYPLRGCVLHFKYPLRSV